MHAFINHIITHFCGSTNDSIANDTKFETKCVKTSSKSFTVYYQNFLRKYHWCTISVDNGHTHSSTSLPVYLSLGTNIIRKLSDFTLISCINWSKGVEGVVVVYVTWLSSKWTINVCGTKLFPNTNRHWKLKHKL